MHIDRFERYWLVIASAVLGAFFAALIAGAVIFGVRLPSSPGDFINPMGLSLTEFANPGIYPSLTEDNVYDAYIVARMWRFDIGSDEKDELGNDIVRLPVGARVNINVTSADVTHGFLIERHNVNIQVIPGHIGRSTVVFREPGVYRLLCHEYCGRGHQQMHSMFIIEEE